MKIVSDFSQSLDRDFYSGPPEWEGAVLKPDSNVRFHGIMSVGPTIRTFELVRRIFMEFCQNVTLLVVTQPAQMLIILIAFDEVQETCKARLLRKILVRSEIFMEVYMKNVILGYNRQHFYPDFGKSLPNYTVSHFGSCFFFSKITCHFVCHRQGYMPSTPSPSHQIYCCVNSIVAGTDSSIPLLLPVCRMN